MLPGLGTSLTGPPCTAIPPCRSPPPLPPPPTHVTPSLLLVHLLSTHSLHIVRRRVCPSGLHVITLLVCQPQFLKATRSPSLLLLPPSPHQLDLTSQSNCLLLRSAVELWKNATDLNLWQWLLVWSIYYNLTHRSLNSTLYPLHDIPLSTWMCNRRSHRSHLYAHGGERHAHNTQIAHNILWCTHRTDYPPQFVHARRHRVSNSCAASGGTHRRTELH